MRLQETGSDRLVFESTATCKCYNQCVLADVWELLQCVLRLRVVWFLILKRRKKRGG